MILLRDDAVGKSALLVEHLTGKSPVVIRAVDIATLLLLNSCYAHRIAARKYLSVAHLHAVALNQESFPCGRIGRIILLLA